MKKSNILLSLHEDFMDMFQTAIDRLSAVEEDDRDVFWQPYHKEGARLIIPVSGMLLNYGNLMLEGFFTSYDYIAETFDKGMNDPEIQEIILDIDSPGGMVQGAFETVALMNSYKNKKKVTARTKGYATSAAYMMAMGADEIVAQESAMLGSIGVIVMHTNMEKRLETQGVEITIIKSGDRKAEGNPYEPLSEETKKRWQASVDRTAERFASLVASKRGLTTKQVLDMQAATFEASEAKQLGLVDKISLVNDKIVPYNGGNSTKENLMTNQPEVKEEQQPSINLEEVQANAAKAAQARIQSIIDCPEAEGREGLSRKLAFETNLTTEQAIEILKASPKAEQKKAQADFDSLMMNTQNPNVGADAKSNQQADTVNFWATVMGLKQEKK